MHTTYLYHRKNIRHRITKYTNSTYVALEKKKVFIWWTVDRRKYNFKSDDTGKKWCFEWVDNTLKGSPGKTVLADRFNLYDHLKHVYQTLFP